MDGALLAERVPEPAAARQLPLSLAGSIALHAGFIAALILLTPLRELVVPEPPAITVDLIPSTAVELDAQPAGPPELAAPSIAPGVPELGAGGLYFATRLYTAQLLQSPEMATVREGLRTVASSERVIQLCNIEALEQIRLAAPHYEPDTLVSYAMSNPIQAGLVLTAAGGAFRSRRQWYNVSFKCVAAPTLDGVTSFLFKLGDAIPESEWEEHYLNAEDKAE
jgi:hypothetical protein